MSLCCPLPVYLGDHDSCACQTNPSPSVNETLHSLQCHDQEDDCFGHHLPSANGSVPPCHIAGFIYFTQ